MKRLSLSIMLTVLMSMVGIRVLAYDAKVGSIYYNFFGSEAQVTFLAENNTNNSNAYSGTIVIPESITYNGNSYTITSIGSSAFRYCSSLSNVIIPSTVVSIGSHAFDGCSRLYSINIPKGVKFIYDSAFEHCDLYSIAIPEGVIYIGAWAFANNSSLSTITIPNDVQIISPSVFSGTAWYKSQPDGLIYIGNHAYQYKGTMPENTRITIKDGTIGIVGYAFNNCTGLTSITIPNSVKSIGADAFNGTTWFNNQPDGMVYAGKIAYKYKGSMPNYSKIVIKDGTLGIAGRAFSDGSYTGNTALASVSIPNSVITIGAEAFRGCIGLTSVSLSNNLIFIDWYSFYGCKELSFISFPFSLKGLGEGAFSECKGLTTISIPSSVMSIPHYSFGNCSSLSSVTIEKESPFPIEEFNSCTHATLYVPRGSKELYEAAKFWQEFMEIVEIDLGETGEEKCAKPAISYSNGQLTFDCLTEDVVFQTSITSSDIDNYTTSSIPLTVTYNISVYATKTGFKKSETATATLCWIEINPQVEGITTDVNQVASIPVMIKAEDGFVTIIGGKDGMNVSVYTIDGVQEGSTIIRNGAAMVNTNIPRDSVAIAKIGNKSVKVIMK